MEIVTIEKKTFDMLLACVDALTQKVNCLKKQCEDKRMNKWMDGEEVCRALRISPRTLQTMRDNRLIGCAQINRKFYYKPEEVERLMPAMDYFREKA